MTASTKPLGCGLSRRDWLRLSAAGVLWPSLSGWFDTFAAETAGNPARRRSCILLWMSGGPSQLDTFDLKPGHENGGEFKEIETAVPGVRISEHLPKVAAAMRHLVPIRSMSTKEADHGQATFLVRNGYAPQGPIRYPTLGSLVAKELGRTDADLPNFVSIAPARAIKPAAYGPGFLGSPYAPLLVGDSPPVGDQQPDSAGLSVENLDAPAGVLEVRR